MALAGLSGNNEARGLLLRALERARLPHALLLHGPPGIGKGAIAQALAEALLCQAPTPDACGACGACWRSAKRAHPDLNYLEREPDAQFIKIEAAREIVRVARLKPYEAHAKVVLVLEADRLSEDSANTLLKTLEEPPPATYIVLVTSSREGVLATIRSRCQALALHAPGHSELCGLLERDHGMDGAEADLRARLSPGNESEAAELDLDAHRESRDRALAVLTPFARGVMLLADGERALTLAEELARKDDAVENFLLATLLPLARDVLVLAAGGRADQLVNRDAAGPIAEVARCMGVNGAAQLLSEIERAAGDLRQNANKRLLVEAVLFGVYLRSAPPPRSR